MKHPLCILKSGELVTGTVSKITKNCVLVDLEDSVVASISSYHIQGKLYKFLAKYYQYSVFLSAFSSYIEEGGEGTTIY